MGVMSRSILILILIAFGAACGATAFADEPKVPVQTDDKGSVYVQPKVHSVDKAATVNGATVGVERKDGSAAYGGVETSGEKPTYSVGGATGGSVSYSAGAHSDGKDNRGVKAGITIKY